MNRRHSLSLQDANTVLNFISSYKAFHNGNSPSYREIMKECGIASTSVVYKVLNDLMRGGHITWRPKVARSIEIIGRDSLPGLFEL